MITFVSKENKLGPGDKKYIWALKVRFLLVRLFSKKTSRYCHSPGASSAASCKNFDIF